MNPGGLADREGVVVPGRELGRGGEGAVFEVVGRPGIAVKLYLAPDRAREAKVVAFARGGYTATVPSAAVPRSVVRSVNGEFAGFTMRSVEGVRPLHDLYGASSRRIHFPLADWRMVVRAAANVARGMAQVHAAGIVVGDVNHSSVLVSARSLVTLIDADSWQLGDEYPCRVGVPEYTPPEIQGRSLDSIKRTEAHDAFGLAVLLAQLLFLGRHPFAGVPSGRPIALPDAIARHQFAYTLVRDVRLRPPSGSLLLSDLPPALRVGFERAFGSMLGPRYPASRWATVLAELERGLAACPRNARHAVPPGASACPWCRIERVTGRPAFGSGIAAGAPAVPTTRPPGIDDARALLVLVDTARLSAAEPPSLAAARVTAGADAVAFAATDGAGHRAMLARVADLAGGVSDDRFTRRHTEAERNLIRALAGWRRRVGVEQVLAAAGALCRDVERATSQAATGHDSLPGPTADPAVAQALRRIRVADARVPGLAAARRALLQADGVATAADVTRPRLSGIAGLGTQCVAALLVWRDELEASASTANSGKSPARDEAAVKARGAETARLVEQCRALRHALDQVMGLAGTTDAAVERSRAEVAAAAADLRFLGLPLPAAKEPSLAVARTTPAGKGQKVKAKGKGRSGAKSGASAKLAKASAALKGTAKCPTCAAPMTRRWGADATRRAYLGCSRYPACVGRRTIGGKRI